MDCEFCGKEAAIVGSDEVYGEGANFPFTYIYCEPCAAWAIYSPELGEPLERLANEARRMKRMITAQYINFMVIVKQGKGSDQAAARESLYNWLYTEMSRSVVPPPDHAGYLWMDDSQLAMAADIIKPHYDRLIVKKRPIRST